MARRLVLLALTNHDSDRCRRARRSAGVRPVLRADADQQGGRAPRTGSADLLPSCHSGGINETVMWSNYWMVEQVLGSRVHGVLLAHARSPEVVKVLVQALG